MAQFARYIGSPSDEEPTHFICPHIFFILNVRFDRTRRRGWLASDSSALVSLVSATCGPERAALCPKCWRTASISVNRRVQWRKESYESYEIRSKILTPHERIQNLSSAQIERHSVTNWWPVALTGLIAGSPGKWSKQFNEMRSPQWTKPKASSIEFIIAIVQGLLQQFSAPLVTSKLNWAWLLTRQKNKATCDDGVLSSSLVSHFCFCRHIASPGETRNINSCNCKRETIIKGSYFAKTGHNDATNLTEFPWEHLSKRQHPHPRKWSTPQQTRFRNCTEHHISSPQGD